MPGFSPVNAFAGMAGISAYALDPQRRLLGNCAPERLNVGAGKLIRSPSSPPLGVRESEATPTPHGNAIVEAVVPCKYNGVTKGIDGWLQALLSFGEGRNALRHQIEKP